MDQETKQILSLCSQDTKVLAKTFFPDRFKLPFAPNIHDKIFELIDGSANKVAIAAPRGWGKTSIVALALMARYILFRHTGFIVYINKSHDAAALQTENLRRELVSNKLIKHFFGSAKASSLGSEFEEVFSKKSWVAYDTLVWPRGAEQQIRGVLFKNDRPGLFIIDDLEDKKKVTNEELRTSLKSWFYSDVLEAIPQLHMNWKIVYIDTLKHEDALLQHLLNSSDWESIRLEACNDDLESTAPDFMPNEIILNKWNMALNAGETDIFFQELRNLPISSKDSVFRKEYFHYYNLTLTDIKQESDLKLTDVDIQLNKSIETIVLLDPAKTVKIHSDETAIIAVGLDTKNSRVFVRDAMSGKMYPDEIYDNLFNMGLMNGANVLGIEETSLNEFIKQPIKNEMFKRGKFFELVWLKPRGRSKEERVKSLVSYYRQGYIYHNSSCATIKKLEQQLLMFPRSALWDLMDCLAYMVEMFEIGGRYFNPHDSSNYEQDLSELSQLYDVPIEGWRYA